MKFVLILMGLLAGTYSYAEEFNLGVILGSTTGISAKYGLGNNRAIDGALAYSSDNLYGTSLHVDYLVENARHFNLGSLSPLTLYYGIGGRFVNIRNGDDRDKLRAGVRAPIGLDYIISNPNLEFFAELAPILDLTPRTDVYFDVGIGVRYRF
jgi:hypothetical protein